MNQVKKTNICFIDFFVYPLFNPKSKIVFGGAQIQLYFLSLKLAKTSQFQVSFLTDDQKTNQTEMFNQINLFKLTRSAAQSTVSFIYKLIIKLKQINADIYIQRAASAETGLIALICKLFKKQFIFMVAHNRDVNGQFLNQNGFRGKLYLLGLKLANKIICQTKHQFNLLPVNLKTKSSILASAYPISKTDPIGQTKKQTILWVARAETWKKPLVFIQLAKQFPKQKFVMICPPAENNPDYYKFVKQKADKVSNLTFIKQVPFKKIDSYFKQAKVFVSTSSSEGFPNTFIQAAKNKTPIISFKVNPDNILDKHQLGFCAQGKKQQLTRLLSKILSNKQLYQQCANHAYQYATTYHQINKSVKALSLIIRVCCP